MAITMALRASPRPRTSRGYIRRVSAIFTLITQAAEDILETPGIGRKIELEKGSKILYSYKTIGISYRADNVYNCLQK